MIFYLKKLNFDLDLYRNNINKQDRRNILWKFDDIR